jgi:hypothetical protein
MEKRSHRRIRDLDILAAFQGLVANEIGCGRISMMAREENTPFNGPNTDARDQLSPDRHIRLASHGRSIDKYMARSSVPPSQGWKTFFRNHADGVASMDLFVVPTISFHAAIACSWLAEYPRSAVLCGADKTRPPRGEAASQC